MKQQVLVIHGGTSFDNNEDYIEFIKTRELTLDTLRQTYDWKASLGGELGEAFDVLQPRMPNGTNARYKEWKIWFERCVRLLEENIILIGQSLGGIFLAKYLSENVLAKKIKATILVAAPFDDVLTAESLNDFKLPVSLDKFANQGGTICIIHSKDDPIVPFGDAAKYQQALPKAKMMLFDDRQHFHQEKFLELVNRIKLL